MKNNETKPKYPRQVITNTVDLSKHSSILEEQISNIKIKYADRDEIPENEKSNVEKMEKELEKRKSIEPDLSKRVYQVKGENVFFDSSLAVIDYLQDRWLNKDDKDRHIRYGIVSKMHEEGDIGDGHSYETRVYEKNGKKATVYAYVVISDAVSMKVAIKIGLLNDLVLEDE